MSLKITGVAISLALATSVATANTQVYDNFPVTVKDYKGDKTSSISYGGQAARQTLNDSLKKLAGKGNGSTNADLKNKMLSYYEGTDAARSIIAPASNKPFVIAESKVSDLSGKKNLAGKTYKGAVTGMPNAMTGPELVKFWIEKASSAKKGVDFANGYDYPQLISKFLLGAVMYNQAVDVYMDEYLNSNKKPNNKPYKDGTAYTGKEHVWDEAFGYFGTPVHTLSLTPKQAYGIAKLGKKAKDANALFKTADYNSDGKINLQTEMVFGPAYYAASADKSGKTNYLHTITKAFIEGRQLITAAKGEKLTDDQRNQLRNYANTINYNWEKVYAEAVFKYAGSVYKDMEKLQTIMDANGETDKQLRKYIKHWGELKGFALALQTGKNNLGETATKLNRLIGFGPLLLNSSQVTDIDSKGNYMKDQSIGWGEYMLHMIKVQKLIADKFDIKAKSNDVTKNMANLIDSMGDAASAEND